MNSNAMHNHAVTVACCQVAPKLADVDYNQQLSERAIRAAAQAGAQIIVLPELVQSGYVFVDKAQAQQLAETTEGATLQLWQRLAKELDVLIVAGFCERGAAQQLYNSAALIDRSGVLGVYRKTHLWDAEGQVFTAGDAPPMLISTAHGVLAVMICYDLEFPEWVRLPALAGADLLCAPVNWPDGPRPQGERPAEIVRVQANASVNRLFIAVCDRAGQERGVDWVGGSVIVDADGYPLTPSLRQPNATEGLLLATINLAQARNKRVSAHNDIHLDRRPALY